MVSAQEKNAHGFGGFQIRANDFVPVLMMSVFGCLAVFFQFLLFVALDSYSIGLGSNFVTWCLVALPTWGFLQFWAIVLRPSGVLWERRFSTQCSRKMVEVLLIWINSAIAMTSVAVSMSASVGWPRR